MFRQFFRNLVIQKSVCDDLLKIRYSTTAVPIKEPDKYGYNHVRLLGTIASTVKTLPNGIKSVIIRTNESENVYFNHHVNVLYDEPMNLGQRIYVFGNLSSKPFSLDDGRLRQRLIIKSKYVRLRGFERTSDDRDLNNVKIMARICSEIKQTNTYTLFTLKASHKPKGEGGISGTVITEFHRVIVYDQLERVTARNLNKFDRVKVEGKLSYMPYKNSTGKTQNCGFIVAQTIELVD